MLKFLNKGISTPIVIIIIVAFAILLVGGALAYQYYYQPKAEENITKTVEENEVNTELKENTNIVIKNETADWKTYTNEKYGFEIKYPKDWSFSTGGITPESEGFQITSPVKDGHADNRIWVLAINDSLADTIFEESEFQKLKAKSTININGATGYKIIWNELDDFKTMTYKEAPPYVYFKIPLSNPVRYILVRFLGFGSQYQENIKIFDQMISTFKFTGQ